MLRDFKFLRRNSSKNSNVDEIENVPSNPRDSLSSQTTAETSRPPLNTIQEPPVSSRGGTEQEVGFKSTRVDRTPTKAKGRNPESGVSLRTPDKQGISSKNRFGWAQKRDSSSNSVDSHDECRVDTKDVTQSSRSVGVGNGGFASMNTPRPTRNVGRATLSYSECNSTQSTPNKSVTKPPNPGLASGSRPPTGGGARVANFATLSRGIPITCSSSTVVNTVEVPAFDLNEDSSFWMDHNVQVLIRVRPLNNAEKTAHGYNRCLKQENAHCITWLGQPETRFTFDHVACEAINQETLFRVVGLPMVENCLSGYNSCMFAYGQTGSGKTYTMLGEIEGLEVEPSQNRGMTPRIFDFLFGRIRAEEEIRRDERLKYNCKCSFLEIYNEQITDLLDPSSTNLLLREDSKNGVYVENLSEFEVHTVGDILKLLSQGSSNRKVASTNMNRESSRSHSVFTCVIESRWEKDSISNLRHARLNLVDLAGSERQKTSGAEGERLKEAANINKSLSTLGHVIMVLVDVANGKPRHVPYRDSRLTFLLQDSLGGNSKTMIIANISPSISCAAETLNTLKFAQRAKLIQNNAVVNEDCSQDVVALQLQIQLLKEELFSLKRQHVSRSLTFGPVINGDTWRENVSICNEKALELDQQKADSIIGCESKGNLRVSSKQLKSLETTLAGALRREKMAETSIKQLEAEMEQLNRLVRQREEDSRCSKMMLKFREDKIQRMESLVEGLMPVDAYLLEENNALSEEIQLLQAKVDKNPEVTRFALENIRLLEQLRRFQDFYEEGEREMLLNEVSELRDQLVIFVDGNLKQHNHSDMNMPSQDAVHISQENDSLRHELKHTLKELEQCRSELTSCLENNSKLYREIDALRNSLVDLKCVTHDHDDGVEVIKESILEASTLSDPPPEAFHKVTGEKEHETGMRYTEELMNLQLELDILKIILQEEKSSRGEVEEAAKRLTTDLELAKGNALVMTKQHENVKEELNEAKSIIEALESQQFLLINEMEELRISNCHNAELLCKQKLEIASLKEEISNQELRDLPSDRRSEETTLQSKLNKMQESLEKAKKMNMLYQTDRAFLASNEEEMDEVRRQVEGETAEVIVCLQEELAFLQLQVQDSNSKEVEAKEMLASTQTEVKELQDNLHLLTLENKRLGELLVEKEKEQITAYEEFELLTNEIEVALDGGHEALTDASDHLSVISSSFPQKRTWISEQLGRMTRNVSEKECLIKDLRHCLEEANNRRNDVDCMLMSLRGAALVMTEAHQQECSEKDNEILLLKSQLSEKMRVIVELENIRKHGQEQLKKSSVCATVAFVMVNRLHEINNNHLDVIKNKDIQLCESFEMNGQKDARLQNQVAAICEAEKQIQSLRISARMMELKLEKIEGNNVMETRNRLDELKTGVSTLRSCMSDYAEGIGTPDEENTTERVTYISPDTKNEAMTGTETNQCIKTLDSVCRGTEDVSVKDATVLLLKKEIESALESLKGVQAEMARLHAEKEEVRTSQKLSKKNIECLKSQVLELQTAMDKFEEQLAFKIFSLDHKLQSVEKTVLEAQTSWAHNIELLELEFGDAKIVAAQKTAEASCILAKFEEAQYTMKEADIMINELMIANETVKFEIEKLKEKEISLLNERDIISTKAQSLESANIQKDLQYKDLEKQFESDLIGTNKLVQELEYIVCQVQDACKEDFMSMASDFSCMKSELHMSVKLMQSWLEDIWSEIIIKDCAVSVLHHCHMGILLETVTGLNAENGLLHHGLCESDSVISDLREHNFKSRRELEMCRALKGKLLVDFKSSFDRISRKEDETEEITKKLSTFEEKILNLQLKEELMLQRSNNMGSDLAMLMKELDSSNNYVLLSLLDQEKMMNDKEEIMKSQEETFVMDLIAKEFESCILASELEQMAVKKATADEEQKSFSAVIEKCRNYITLLNVDAELTNCILQDKEEVVHVLQKKVGEEQREQHNLLSEMENVNKALQQDISLLKEVAYLNDALKGELHEMTEAKRRLESEYAKLLEDVKVKEAALESSSSHVSILDQQHQKLKSEISLLEESLCILRGELELKDTELGKMHSLEEDNGLLRTEILKLKADYDVVFQDLEMKKSDLESSFRNINAVDAENKALQDKVLSLESCISSLQADLDTVNREVNDLQHQANRVDSLKKENDIFRDELRYHEKSKHDFLTNLNSNMMKCIDSVDAADTRSSRVLNILDKESITSEKQLQELFKNVERTSVFIKEFECLENLSRELLSETSTLQAELSRKDGIVEGLLFDLSLLQESASNAKDHKDEIEELVASMDALETELEAKSHELDESIAKGLILEAKLQETMGIISSLEFEVSEKRESVISLSRKNSELTTDIQRALEAKCLLEEELVAKMKANELLETELAEMGTALSQLNNSLETLRSNLNEVTCERDELQAEIPFLRRDIEMAQALAEENEALAMEAREVAETRKNYAEDKEEEVKLLEKSVEELERTVDALESKVDVVKGEAERQRLQREELELELHAVKEQMYKRNGDADIRSLLDEKEKNLQDALWRIQILERDIAAKNAEIAQCKAHICELNLHSEAQACEYKQKFKELEAMAEQVKAEGPSSHASSSSINKLEKNGSKSRGSGSPFKCIGLGLAQQIKTERDEELNAGRHRIEELEALAANRQKEVFMLNTRLAAAESMTHDVIRDLLGLKLDINNCASLLDNEQVQKITEKARLSNVDAQSKEPEVIMLKQQLNEFVEERKRWLEEIDRKQAEMVAAQVALENLRQRDQLLTTENEMFKAESVNHKKKVRELEAEVKKLSGQQNLHQRIHHHAKIKEENNLLKIQNEELSSKLRRTEGILLRVKEELAHFRAAYGRNANINFDEEQRLNDKLKETEEERMHLAQKLLGLCTSILKAAGITRPNADINVAVAEQVLEQLKRRLTSLERELQDLNFKNRISNERIRLSELIPQPSPNRVSESPFLSTFER